MARIGSCWFFGSRIESVVVPASVCEVGAEAFGRCGALRGVSFSEGSRLRVIGRMGFYGCRLEEILLPASLEEVREYAFYGNMLRSVIFQGSRLREVGDYAFGGNEGLKYEKVQIPADARVSGEAFTFDYHREL